MIPSSKTPGGHRRYNREDIKRLSQQLTSHSIPALTATSYSVPSLDWHISAEHLSVQPWRAHLAPPYDTGSTMRALGQRVLGLLIQYITRSQDDARFLEEAQDIGARHGVLAARYGASLREAVEAFTFFRKTFSQTSLQIPQVSHSSDSAEIVRLAQRIGQFMDRVLLGLVFGYETEQANLPSEPTSGPTSNG